MSGSTWGMYYTNQGHLYPYNRAHWYVSDHQERVAPDWYGSNPATGENGLSGMIGPPSRFKYTIMQDSAGYLWAYREGTKGEPCHGNEEKLKIEGGAASEETLHETNPQLWKSCQGHNNVKQVEIDNEDESITLYIAVSNDRQYKDFLHLLDKRSYKHKEI